MGQRIPLNRSRVFVQKSEESSALNDGQEIGTEIAENHKNAEAEEQCQDPFLLREPPSWFVLSKCLDEPKAQTAKKKGADELGTAAHCKSVTCSGNLVFWSEVKTTQSVADSVGGEHAVCTSSGDGLCGSIHG